VTKDPMTRRAVFPLAPKPGEDPWHFLHRLANKHGRFQSLEVTALFSHLFGKPLMGEIRREEWLAILPGQIEEIDAWLNGRTGWDLRAGVNVAASKRHCRSCVRSGRAFPLIWQTTASGGHCAEHLEVLQQRCDSCNDFFRWDQGTLLECPCGRSLIRPVILESRFRARRGRRPSATELAAHDRVARLERDHQLLRECYAATPRPFERFITLKFTTDSSEPDADKARS
jgi:hypothetical protein